MTLCDIALTLQQIEAVGSESGNVAQKITIIDCGLLPKPSAA